MIARKLRKTACKHNNTANKDSDNKEVADIGSENGKVVNTTSHTNGNSNNDSDNYWNESENDYSRSDDDLVREHDENVGNIRDSEGGYDSVDDLFYS